MSARVRGSAFAVLVLWQSATVQAGSHEHRYDFETFRARMEEPERARWQKPEEVVRALGLRGGERVADIGAGTGYFSTRLAHAVGGSGRVYAVDIDERAVAYMRRRFEGEGLGQIEVILGRATDPLLPGEVDLVFTCDTWHHIDDRPAYARRLRRHLSGRGRLVIVDFKPDADPTIGPPPARRLSAELAIDELRRSGFDAVRQPDFLPLQYVIVATPAGQP